MSLPSIYPVQLSGGHLALREIRAEDAEAAFVWGSDREYFRFLPFEPVVSMDQERAFVEEVIRVANAKPRLDYHLAVTIAATDELVGLVDLRITSVRHRSAELGFGLCRHARGHGYATQAARLLMEFGFSALGLHRIHACHHPDNVASSSVLERLGMTREGHLRENLLDHGRWRDSVVYSVLEHEWRADVEPE